MPYTVLNPATAAAAPSTTAGAALTSVGETLATFQAQLQTELMQRTDVSATQLKTWINQGYRNVSQSIDIQELWASVSLSLVANQPFYLVPTVLSWIKRISLVDSTDFPVDGGRELDMIDEPTYRDYPETSALIGNSGNATWLIPSAYFRYARMVVVWPTPQTTYTASLDFRVRPVDLSASTDSPILPSEFHEAILHAARVRTFRTLKMYKEAAMAQNDLVVTLRPLQNSDAHERDAMNMVMQPVTAKSQLYRSRY